MMAKNLNRSVRRLTVVAAMALAVPAGVPVRAMVRPRAGGFDYGAEDMALALAEPAAGPASPLWATPTK